MGSREETDLALLEWQDRIDRWTEFPETDRAALVTELARLMTRVATEGSDDERQGPHFHSEAQGPGSRIILDSEGTAAVPWPGLHFGVEVG